MKAFRLTPRAKRDLSSLLTSLAEGSPQAARQVGKKIRGAFADLARSPGIGHYREDLLNRRYRFWTVYSYVIAYAWEERPVEIVAVVHGARELNRFLAPRG